MSDHFRLAPSVLPFLVRQVRTKEKLCGLTICRANNLAQNPSALDRQVLQGDRSSCLARKPLRRIVPESREQKDESRYLSRRRCALPVEMHGPPCKCRHGVRRTKAKHGERQ